MKMICCFNPYSIGFYSLIIIRTGGNLCPKKFQSLFYWILFSYESTAIPTTVLFLFQSLFYWILFSYLVDQIVEEAAPQSFNPYSTGFSFFIINLTPHPVNVILFQSLFYWILFFYPFYIEDSLFLTLIEFF